MDIDLTASTHEALADSHAELREQWLLALRQAGGEQTGAVVAAYEQLLAARRAMRAG